MSNLIWASGSIVGGRIGKVTSREWPVEKESADDYATADQVDGVIAVTTVWRPGAREVEVDVLGTEPAAVQAAWDEAAEEAEKRTVA